MSAVPGAPLPTEGPPTATNPWTLAAAVAGAGAVVVGALLALLGGPNGFAADAEPGTTRVLIGLGLVALGIGLLLCALVLAGVGWYLSDGRSETPVPGSAPRRPVERRPVPPAD